MVSVRPLRGRRGWGWGVRGSRAKARCTRRRATHGYCIDRSAVAELHGLLLRGRVRALVARGQAFLRDKSSPFHLSTRRASRRIPVSQEYQVPRPADDERASRAGHLPGPVRSRVPGPADRQFSVRARQPGPLAPKFVARPGRPPVERPSGSAARSRHCCCQAPLQFVAAVTTGTRQPAFHPTLVPLVAAIGLALCQA